MIFEEEHVHVKVTSQNLGEFEIRIRNFDPLEEKINQEIE